MNNKKINEIGLGCVTFGREIDERRSLNLLDYAYEKGINFFDTAAAYGEGASETIIGRWLSAHPHSLSSVTIATKVLPPYEAVPMKESVNRSLERLRVDAVDILYLHRWDTALRNPEVLAVLDELVKTGKARMLGASNFTTEQLNEALALQQTNGFEPFRFAQNNHNLAVSDINTEFRQLSADRDVDIVAYSPLGAGFLTGKHHKGVEAGSRFAIMPGHQDVYFNEKAYRRLHKLHTVATRTGYSPVHLALAWALHQPGISSVLIGVRSLAHIDQAFKAKDFNAPHLFAELEVG